MSLPAASVHGGHHEFLLEVQQRLLREYAELLEHPAPVRRAPAAGTARPSVARRLRPTRVRPVRRRQPPVYRFDDPPLAHLRLRHRPGQKGVVRMFVLLLVLHLVVIAGIVIGDVLDWTLGWKAVGTAFLIWLVFRFLAALSRRVHQRRRTSSRSWARNCDRDISL